MNAIGHPERVTQNRVITLLKDELSYAYLAGVADSLSQQGRLAHAVRS